MYVDNQFYYGHLVNSAHYETSHVHNDLYSIMDNPYVSPILLIWTVDGKMFGYKMFTVHDIRLFAETDHALICDCDSDGSM